MEQDSDERFMALGSKTDIELVLRVLALKVYTSRVHQPPIEGSTPNTSRILSHLRDASDFRAWLLELAEKARISTDTRDFLQRIDRPM